MALVENYLQTKRLSSIAQFVYSYNQTFVVVTSNDFIDFSAILYVSKAHIELPFNFEEKNYYFLLLKKIVIIEV